MMATEAEKGRIVEVLKAGATNYVIKPFEPQTIIQKITEVIEKSGG
jgi:DNA-binding response OmpR family regulator